ncbi:hypothetical protein HG536_0E04800 [Torulaspora globosa]|uniref:DNA-directed RNA polymerase III subunit RPC9 n=1 Tax=Torulaspora globosa TaxID=48254 RepID=A0A7G3ZJ83_9SACH|nr:uncharacterized protein HG536_0E04800 [Torulaspora globosa]QLL33569.1 hypothetical protein HG536_0E04800 [Torulaspora globosa]
MKILEARDAFFSDYETLQFLSKLERQHHWDEDSTTHDRRDKKKIKTHKPYNNPELQAITRDTIAYLTTDKGVPQEDDESSGNNDKKKSAISSLNDQRFSELVAQLNNFDLFKAEKLQIVNQLPTTMVHLYAVVEECDTRFTQEQIEQILGITAQYL